MFHTVGIGTNCTQPKNCALRGTHPAGKPASIVCCVALRCVLSRTLASSRFPHLLYNNRNNSACPFARSIACLLACLPSKQTHPPRSIDSASARPSRPYTPRVLPNSTPPWWLLWLWLWLLVSLRIVAVVGLSKFLVCVIRENYECDSRPNQKKSRQNSISSSIDDWCRLYSFVHAPGYVHTTALPTN